MDTYNNEESLRTPGVRSVLNSVLNLSAIPGLQMMQSFKRHRHVRLVNTDTPDDNNDDSTTQNTDGATSAQTAKAGCTSAVRQHTLRWFFTRRRSVSSPKLLAPNSATMDASLDPSAGDESAIVRSVSSQDVTLATREAQMDAEAQGHVGVLGYFTFMFLLKFDFV